MKGVWEQHFEHLMNEKTVEEAIVTNIGMAAHGERVCGQRN